jgi:hypothetical protein
MKTTLAGYILATVWNLMNILQANQIYLLGEFASAGEDWKPSLLARHQPTAVEI